MPIPIPFWLAFLYGPDLERWNLHSLDSLRNQAAMCSDFSKATHLWETLARGTDGDSGVERQWLLMEQSCVGCALCGLQGPKPSSLAL